MFKRLMLLFLAVTISLAFLSLNSRPVFSDYSNKIELYFNSSSSMAQIVNIDSFNKQFFFSVRGESFKVDKQAFDLENFLKEFSALMVFVEEIEEGVSYYAYSPKIKYRAKILGKTVNLHIFLGKQITVGSPLIFGSF